MKALLNLIVPALYKWTMTAIMMTCRVERLGQEHLKALHARNQAWIYSAWHNNTAVGVWDMRNRGFAMMASASEDGELIARGISAFGNMPIRGSSSAHGGKAMRDMVQALRNGRSAAVTPDGPRGPKYKLQPGILWIAVFSKCPLVPYHIEASRQWVLRKSWDHHKIPKPFSTVYVSVGKPYFVDGKRLRSDEEGLAHEFERLMFDNALQCERLANRATVNTSP